MHHNTDPHLLHFLVYKKVLSNIEASTEGNLSLQSDVLLVLSHSYRIANLSALYMHYRLYDRYLQADFKWKRILVARRRQRELWRFLRYQNFDYYAILHYQPLDGRNQLIPRLHDISFLNDWVVCYEPLDLRIEA